MEPLPGLRPKPTDVIVIAEAGEFEDGEGARASLTPNALLVEFRADGGEASMVIPVVTLLEAIQTQTHKHES